MSWLCDQRLTCHHGGQRSNPGQSMWNLRWRKWHCDKSLSEFCVLSCQSHSTNAPCSFIYHICCAISAIHSTVKITHSKKFTNICSPVCCVRTYGTMGGAALKDI